MPRNNEVQEDYQLYLNGTDYNRRLTPPYYTTIDRNYRFYEGDHWHGVNAKGLPTLIMPVYERVADHEIATILSSPIKAKFSIENFDEESQDPEAMAKQKKVDMLNYKCEDKWEKDKLNSLLRDCLVDGFNTGDYCIYTYWDKSKSTKQYYGVNPETEKKQEIIGDFCCELVDGSNVMFGNPNNINVEAQPYIIIAGRGLVSDLKKEAKANGISKEDIEKIEGDTDYQEQSADRGKIELDNKTESSKCLYLIKFWKKDGIVYYRKCTKYTTIIKKQSTGLKRYPIAWGNWKKRKNSYHGQAPGTILVPNQISINQMYSMVVYHMRMTAFGKVAYDKTRINGYNNEIGAAIPVEGPIDNVIQQLPPGQMNNGIFGFMGDVITQTKDLNGANDAALGDVNPEQASGIAIVSTAKQATIPLETPEQNLYQFVEDLMLIWEDFIESKYTIPRQIGYKDDGVQKVGEINGEDYKDIPLSIKIDVGPSTQWSEITSVATLDKLLLNKEINLLQYLERLPDGFINNKQGLIDELRAMQQDQDLLFQSMAQFMDSLPPEIQEQLKRLPPEQMESQIKKMMAQQGQQPNQQMPQSNMM